MRVNLMPKSKQNKLPRSSVTRMLGLQWQY